MKEEKKLAEVESARRSLLKKIGVSGGTLSVASSLPETWVKPLLNVAVVPAHATMSVGGTGDPGDGTTTAAPTTTATPTTTGAPTTTPTPTTTAPPCELVSVSATGPGEPGPVHTDTSPNLPNSDAMNGPEFESFEATTINCPDGTEVSLDISIINPEDGFSGTYSDTQTTTANMATFGPTPVTNAGTGFNANGGSMMQTPSTGTATFTVESSMLSITLDWTPDDA